MKVEQNYAMHQDPQYHRRRIEMLARVINGGLDFGSPAPLPAGTPAPPPGTPTVSQGPGNMSGVWVTINVPSANVPFTVTHNLGRIPNGMLVFSVDQPGAVISSVNKTQWTTTTAQFQSNVANVNVVGFVS